MSFAPRWPSTFQPGPAEASSSRGERGAVASTDVLATRVGLDVLAGGGNAVDGAVAVALALAVVNPEAGNLGGGGFVLLRWADGSVHAQDHRSTAPAAATPDMFWAADGGVSEASVIGPLAAAVPGSVAGLFDLHRRWGRLSWGRLVEPAVGLAQGFTVRPRYLESLPPHIVDGLSRFPESAAVFLPGGEPPAVGSTLVQSDLADTLRRLRDHGVDGFYTGPTADRLVDGVRDAGGVITHEDLASYRPVWRAPVRFAWGDHTVWSMPPSSSGGVTLALARHALGARPSGLQPWHDVDHLHWVIEAWRRAFADRNHWLGDTDAVDVPLETLLDPAYGRTRGGDIDPGMATPSAAVRPGAVPPPEGRHTTHVSVVDEDGAAVSYTTTLNTWYGSKMVAPGTGVLLNNEMDDFTARTGVPNFFGLIQGEANAIAPGKRMLSAMTPTIVTGPDGGLRLVVGSPGGATIITTVFQVVSNVVDYGMSLPDAVAAPRVHHQHLPDRIDVEPGGLSIEVIAALRERGHTVVEAKERWGDVEAVEVLADGILEAVADPRRGGRALAR
ncbi:MAG: gamma-glutamyltransferase [Gemmatimonadetes bacterium]|nr:gamma-glutamyltransferase [Gemmatimonadota bacterium]